MTNWEKIVRGEAEQLKTNVLIIGSEGSMGRRYQAILRSLNVNFEKLDIINTNSFETLADGASHFIVASPTVTHDYYLFKLRPYQKPVLCEKPMLKDTQLLKTYLNAYTKMNTPLSIMIQYKKLVHPNSVGDSYYDYFRTGPDGLIWDCFQIIGLAQGSVIIDNKSPIWKCAINGRELSLSDMDQAYVDSVKDFLDGKYISHDLIIEMHEKVINHLRKHEKSFKGAS